MNIALAGTACRQILNLFEFAFGYPESKEFKKWGKLLEESEWHFESEDESSTEEDTIIKQQDEKDAVEQYADPKIEPKAKKHKFGKCHDNLKDLVLLTRQHQSCPP